MDKLSNYKFVTKAPESNILVVSTFPKFSPFPNEGLGRKILQIANEKIKLDYDNNEYLKNRLSCDSETGELRGSSTFLAPIVEDIVSEIGLHITRLASLERRMRNGEIDTRGKYVDLGVALRSKGPTNEYLATSLIAQIKERNDGRDPEMPTYVDLRDLKTVKDPKAPQGLGLILRDGAQIFYAPVLKHENNGKEFSETDGNGFPILDKNGDRTLYTISSGLAQVCLDGSLVLDSGCDDLAGSYSVGRVVIDGDAVAAQKTDVQSK